MEVGTIRLLGEIIACLFWPHLPTKITLIDMEVIARVWYPDKTMSCN